MYAPSVKGDGGRSPVEIFVFQFAFHTAVQGVGPVRVEFFDVEKVGPRPISSSGVKPIRMSPCLISGWDWRYSTAERISAIPALVVRAQEGRAVRGDQRAAFVVRDLRKIGRAQDDAFAQGEVAAVVIFPDEGLDVFAVRVGRGVPCGR